MQTHFEETMKLKGSARILYTSRFKLTVVTCALEKGNRAAARQYQVDEERMCEDGGNTRWFERTVMRPNSCPTVPSKASGVEEIDAVD